MLISLLPKKGGSRSRPCPEKEGSAVTKKKGVVLVVRGKGEPFPYQGEKETSERGSAEGGKGGVGNLIFSMGGGADNLSITEVIREKKGRGFFFAEKKDGR